MRLYPSIGKTATCICSVCTVAAGGRAVRMLAMRPCMSWSVCWTSLPQSRFTEISVDPRPVIERTTRTPGTLLAASSSGFVTSIIIRSAGSSPLSARMTMRGNVTSGKSDTGMRWRRATPEAANTAIVKRMARLWRRTYSNRVIRAYRAGAMRAESASA